MGELGLFLASLLVAQVSTLQAQHEHVNRQLSDTTVQWQQAVQLAAALQDDNDALARRAQDTDVRIADLHGDNDALRSQLHTATALSSRTLAELRMACEERDSAVAEAAGVYEPVLPCPYLAFPMGAPRSPHTVSSLVPHSSCHLCRR